MPASPEFVRFSTWPPFPPVHTLTELQSPSHSHCWQAPGLAPGVCPQGQGTRTGTHPACWFGCPERKLTGGPAISAAHHGMPASTSQGFFSMTRKSLALGKPKWLWWNEPAPHPGAMLCALGPKATLCVVRVPWSMESLMRAVLSASGLGY